MSHPRSTLPPVSSPELYVGSRKGMVPLFAGIGVVSLWCAWGTFSTAQSGEMAPAPDDPAWLGVIPYVIAVGAGLFGLWMLLTLPLVRPVRFEVGREGIRWQKVYVPWDGVQAVRLVVDTPTEPLHAESVNVTLEVRLRDAHLAESRDRALGRMRIPAPAAEGFSHRFPVERGDVSLQTDPTLRAPDLQGVLARVAAPLYQGVAVRITS